MFRADEMTEQEGKKYVSDPGQVCYERVLPSEAHYYKTPEPPVCTGEHRRPIQNVQHRCKERGREGEQEEGRIIRNVKKQMRCNLASQTLLMGVKLNVATCVYWK